jgi:hypothetical protein
MGSATDEPTVRRSSRNKRARFEIVSPPPSITDAAQAAATAGKTQNAKKNKRKYSLTEPEETGVKRGVLSTEQLVKPRFFCPISGCTYSLSTARGLKIHYNTKHEDLTDKEEWNSDLAIRVPPLERLAIKKRRAASTKTKKKKSKRCFQSNGVDPGAGEPPTQSQAPATVNPAASATAAVNREGSPGPPPKKRRKLDDLLDIHRGQLQNFVKQEMREAKDRADNAEAQLQSVTAEREAEVPSDAQENVQKLTTELARSQDQTQKMEGKIRRLEKEVRDEKAWGSSTLLKEKYLHQARAEAKIAAKLNPNRPVRGGFVY